MTSSEKISYVQLGGSLSGKPEQDVLMAIKMLAVRKENTMVARARCTICDKIVTRLSDHLEPE